jgi:hypothetical protein
MQIVAQNSFRVIIASLVGSPMTWLHAKACAKAGMGAVAKG